MHHTIPPRKRLIAPKLIFGHNELSSETGRTKSPSTDGQSASEPCCHKDTEDRETDEITNSPTMLGTTYRAGSGHEKYLARPSI